MDDDRPIEDCVLDSEVVTFCPECENLMYLVMVDETLIPEDGNGNTKEEKECEAVVMMDEGGGGGGTGVDPKNISYLERQCLHCGYSMKIQGNSIRIQPLHTKKHASHPTQNVNTFSRYDVTLPRAVGMKCPNKTCPANSSGTAGRGRKRKITEQQMPIVHEVVYMRYNDEDMLYSYICRHCNANWTMENGNVVYDPTSASVTKEEEKNGGHFITPFLKQPLQV